MVLLNRGSRIVNRQEMILQENPDNLDESGRVPRSINVYMQRHQKFDKTPRIGDCVTIQGFFSYLP